MEINAKKIETFSQGKDHIIISIANHGFLDMLKNWIKSLERLGIENYVVFALDKELFDELTALNINVLPFASDVPLSSGFSNWRTREFTEIVFCKILIVQKLLKMGFNVLLSDGDIIWLDDPMKYMSLDNGFDIQIQLNSGLFKVKTPIKILEYNTGFYLAKSNKKTIDFFEATTLLPGRDDQDCFNKILRQRGEDVTYSTSGKIEKDENKLLVRVLDPLKFPTGWLYFKRHGKFMGFNSKPVIVHANYIKGRSKKISKLKKFNLWYLPEKE